MNACKLMVIAPLVIAAGTTQADENESLFIASQGRLIIPHLNVGNEVYYVELQRKGTAFTFDLLGPSVTKVTPSVNDAWASADQILGSWQLAAEGAAGPSLDIEADGSFTLTLPADSEEGCSAGAETGKYSYNPDTGVFVPRVLTDGNQHCGFSNPSQPGQGPFRMHKVSNGLELWVYDPAENEISPEINLLVPR